MKQIKKKDLKEVIRLTKKWYDGMYEDDILFDELYKARIKAFGKAYTPYNDLVMSIVRIKGKTPLSTYYKVFEALGYELV